MAIQAKSIGIGIIIGLLLSAGYVYWKSKQVPKSVVGEVTAEIKESTATPEVRTVYVYKTINKPPGTPTTTEVLTAVKTETGTATALLDESGRASIVLQTDLIPWLAFKQNHQATIIYGRMDSEMVTRVGYKWRFLQVKRLELGLAAEANIAGDSRSLVGIELSYRW